MYIFSLYNLIPISNQVLCINEGTILKYCQCFEIKRQSLVNMILEKWSQFEKKIVHYYPDCK